MLSHVWKPLAVFVVLAVAAGTFSGLATARALPRADHRRHTARQHYPRKGQWATTRSLRCVAPRITNQPTGSAMTAPAGTAFRAAGSTPPGCSTPSVRWQVSSEPGGRFASISGATSSTLTVPSTRVSMSGTRYRAVFTNRAGSTATDVVTLTVHLAPAAPIRTPPTAPVVHLPAEPFAPFAPFAPTPPTPLTPLTPPNQQSQLFATNSVWNQPLAANALVDPSSPARITRLLGFIDPPGPGVWLNWSQYSVPVYRVPADQPTVRVTLDTTESFLQQAWQAVPIPPSATPAPGADGSVVLYQPSTDKMWEFWQLSKQSDGFHARWGGAMANVSSNPGYYSASSWPGLNSGEGWSWGASASSLPAVAGLMTISELQSGQINHALSVAAPDACSWFVWPAQRTDGTSTDPNCLPEGAHLRLDPSLNLSSLNLPPIALMLARAIQRYGVIVHDTSNSSLTLFAEQPTDGTDPYDSPTGIFGGLQEWQFLSMIPWNRLQLLQLGSECVHAPCGLSGS
jgi:hypothetical protein